jgi:hypothetical protein
MSTTNNTSAEELMNAEIIHGRTIFNLDDANRLPKNVRRFIRGEIDPAIEETRNELMVQMDRILESFKANRERQVRRLPDPNDPIRLETDRVYRSKEMWFISIHKETRDLEILINNGAPLPFIESKGRLIRENLDHAIAELDQVLPKLKWWCVLEIPTQHEIDRLLKEASGEEEND